MNHQFSLDSCHPYPKNERPPVRENNRNADLRPPVEKMEVDPSVQTRNVNYMNRPNPFKRSARSENFPRKHQRLFHTVPDASEQDHDEEKESDKKPDDFLSFGRLVYLT
ncbi:unnamed protein product [Ceratitis capitata]|uniref:(Mediterranean fruit fly) hypothetical protein n=1 Tax=Ceratitis capitata TaxID=7213 RepID=A0A811UUF2_CERCA|nr:unnamed protein product [Ceratitis capitata]